MLIQETTGAGITEKVTRGRKCTGVQGLLLGWRGREFEKKRKEDQSVSQSHTVTELLTKVISSPDTYLTKICGENYHGGSLNCCLLGWVKEVAAVLKEKESLNISVQKFYCSENSCAIWKPVELNEILKGTT